MAGFQIEVGNRLLRRDTLTTLQCPDPVPEHRCLRGAQPDLCPKKALALLAAAVPRRSVGNWLAAVSEASLSTSFMTGVPSFGKASDVDYQDGEPELVRITSLESEANSEAMLRLFGRKPPPTSRKLNSLSEVCEETESPLKREATVTRPAHALTTAAIPALVRGANSPDLGGSEAEGPEPSPRGSVYSTSSCHGVEAGEVESRRCSTPREEGSHTASFASIPEHLEAQGRLSGGVEPTCAVDLYSWRQQSLESILSTEPTGCQREAEGAAMTPRAVLESSVLDLIGDPVVKAKIRSLHLFTDAVVPNPCPGDELAPGVKGDSRRDDFTEVCNDDTCDSPDSREDSPPPLERRFTGKRDSVFEDCWLTGEQRRRKASALCDVESSLSDDSFKRRRV